MGDFDISAAAGIPASADNIISPKHESTEMAAQRILASARGRIPALKSIK